MLHLVAATAVFTTSSLKTVTCEASDLSPCPACATYCIDNPNDCASNDTVYALFPIVPVDDKTVLMIGNCLPAETLATAVDYPYDYNPAQPDDVYLQLRQGGPGWYIANNKLKSCPAGYYCPHNSSVGYYDQKISCDTGDNEFCATYQTEPYQCSKFYNCNGKAIRATVGGAVTFAILFIFMVGFWCFHRHRRQRMHLASQKLAALHSDDDVRSGFGQEFREAAANGVKTIEPASIEFKDVGLTLNNAKPGTPPILQGVTGRVPPGSLVALMGPSGCGKTTFMNAMLGRTPYGTTTGTVCVNGDADMPLLKKKGLAGFVPQDDIVHANMTVFQNLYYHALLRLPASTPHEQKVAHVQHVIKVLGLGKVQDHIVGCPERRGISGGQKKRVNIGLELVAMPSVLFMDEPTSGLDGAATVSLAQCMGLLRRSGLTIVCVIHQPRWLVFQEFTHVLLLGEGGKTVYCGRSDLLVPYLSSLGFKRPEFENPADWMIDVCAGMCERRGPDGSVDEGYRCPENLYTTWEQHEKPNCLKPSFKWTEGDPAPDATGDAVLPPLQARVAASTCQSFRILLGRAFRMIDMSSFGVECLVVFLIAMPNVLAAVLGDGKFTWNGLLHNTLTPSLLYYLVIALQHRADYGDNMLILTRELNSSISVSALYLSLAVRTFVLVTIKSLLYSCISYAFNTPTQNFIFYWLTYLLGAWCWTGFVHWVTIAIKNQMTAMLVIVLVNILEILYSGSLCMPGISEQFCLVNTLKDQAIIPPYFGGWAAVGALQTQTLWATELERYPDYSVNVSFVNQTNYFYNIAPFDDLQAPDYAKEAIGGFLRLTILGCLHQAVVFFLLYSLQTWVVAARKERNTRIRGALRAFITCNCGSKFATDTGVEVPQAEMDRLRRTTVVEPSAPAPATSPPTLNSIAVHSPAVQPDGTAAPAA